jgi:hypothetical protein
METWQAGDRIRRSVDILENLSNYIPWRNRRNAKIRFLLSFFGGAVKFPHA